uniref:Uncharacterized protein n=1 Tax=Coconut foliar decay alphasatellite 4 TaxID=2161877 RepID=A0A2R4N9F4_9VIRU|nr:hypothetical protein [Coconut foliar decay alphasatellite 4]
MVIWEWEWILRGPSSPFHCSSECNAPSVSAWVFQAEFIRLIIKSIDQSSLDSRTSRDAVFEDGLLLRTVHSILFVGAVCLFEVDPVILQDRLQSLQHSTTPLQMQKSLKMFLSGCRSSLFPYNSVGKGQRLHSPDKCCRLFVGVVVEREAPAAASLGHLIITGRAEVRGRGGVILAPPALYTVQGQGQRCHCQQTRQRYLLLQAIQK